jgi:phage terminase large subunit-like protein
MIYELPKDADWTDESLWPLANPTLGQVVRLESMWEDCKKALMVPSEQTKFRRLSMNQWVNARSVWVEQTAWDLCKWNSKPIY